MERVKVTHVSNNRGHSWITRKIFAFDIYTKKKFSALKLEFDYVDLESNQDFLDVGEGKFPDKPILTNSR